MLRALVVQLSIFTAFRHVYDVPFLWTAAGRAASAFVGMEALLQHCSKVHEETSLLRSAVVKKTGCAVTLRLFIIFCKHVLNVSKELPVN